MLIFVDCLSGQLHYAYIIIEDKVEQPNALNCFAIIGNQVPVHVGSYFNLNPAANGGPIPKVSIEYPRLVDGTMVAKEEDSPVCISGKTCKVVAIFGGL